MLSLPDPETQRLPGSPLELVVCQIQFAEAIDVASDPVGLQLAAALGDDYLLEGVVNQQPMVQFAVGPPSVGPPGVSTQQAPRIGWKLSRGPWSVTCVPDGLTIETSDYSQWADLEAVLAQSLGALHGTVGLKSEQRLGLRYVDRIRRPDVDSVGEWQRWINPWVIGPIADEAFRDSVVALQQQVDFDAGEGLRTTLRSAIFADPANKGRAVCVLDFDTYRLGYRPFDREEVQAAFQRLHRLSLKMFQAAITPELFKEFQGADHPA